MPVTLKQAIKKHKVLSFIVHEENVNLLGGASPVLLSFDMQHQVQGQWCWAATAASVSIFYDAESTWTQCLIAQQIMGTTCCITPSPCNKPWFLNEALSVTNNFVKQSSPLTFEEVEAELSAGRVVGARVGWPGGNGHFVVIYGCKTVDGVNYYSIDDPIDGKSDTTEAGFMEAYQSAGIWTHSYTTKP